MNRDTNYSVQWNILICFLILALKAHPATGQVIVMPVIDAKSMPEHGFLPGKKFPIYSTISKYNFRQHHIRVELYDDRQVLNLTQVNCSTLPFTNVSELVNPSAIYKLEAYLDTLFNENEAVVDSTSGDVLRVKLEGLDVRQIGFGKINVHGLCQIRFVYKNLSKTYCSDIVDGDQNAPLGRNSFVTRKTAMRYMASAAIRETIEQFFVDFNTLLARE